MHAKTFTFRTPVLKKMAILSNFRWQGWHVNKCAKYLKCGSTVSLLYLHLFYSPTFFISNFCHVLILNTKLAKKKTNTTTWNSRMAHFFRSPIEAYELHRNLYWFRTAWPIRATFHSQYGSLAYTWRLPHVPSHFFVFSFWSVVVCVWMIF